MIKLKTLFRSKDDVAAYEGLVLIWPCADKISSQLASLLTESKHQEGLLHVVQNAISAYHQPYPFYMTDWERLAVYLIVTINFVTECFAGKKSFHDIVESCSMPRRMTSAFIEDTALKLSMELEHA
ncbi:hypothetical protein ACLI07_23175 (plasmid) [Providencia huaxiensis]|uniref:Uncharacterized protein n=7 Tax=Enterobacterales TaxID=91347 RepID=A0A7L8KBZ0_ECOLX|nr:MULTISPECIES: hypothetical protein [Enterobacterales]ELB1214860.1 hypothetical protein [Proteus mirabilis]ELY4881502.1 hypothetical protein [Morganella morganii]SPY66568.1 Uncharacterised protein [Providencia stuartii]ELR5094301.1 hypothetical protein [Providencia rettgeri]ELR5243150.1 hypothetical protein [Providencia rettgeri]